MIAHSLRNLTLWCLLLFVSLLVLLFSPSQPQQAFSSQVNLYFDLVVDDNRHQIYGANSENETVDIINQDTLEVITTIDVGGEPRGMDIDPTGNELAVALYSVGEIAFVDLNTLQITARVTPEDAYPNRPLDVLYGRPGRFYSVGDGGSGSDRIHIFDTTTKEEIGSSQEIVRARPRITITEDSDHLFVASHFSPNNLYRYDISTEPITRTNSTPHGPARSRVIAVSQDGTYVYTSLGQIWSGDLSTQLGTFDLSGVGMFISYTDIGYAHAKNRVFISVVDGYNKSQLIEFDGATFQRLRHYRFDHPIQAPRPNQSGTKIYISTVEGVQSFSAELETAAFLPLVYNNFCNNFFDDFSNPASGWPIIDNDFVHTQYVNGEYSIQSKQDGYFYLFRAPTCNREHYEVEVDARWQGATGSSYGLIFGMTDDNSHFYLFDINSDLQQYRLLRRNPAGFTEIVAPTSSSAIHSGTASNRLNVIRNGNQITLSINNSTLGTWFDGTITGPTGAGIVSSPYMGHHFSDARFDNFNTRLLSGSNMERAASQTNDSNAPNYLVEPFPVNLDLDW